MVAVPQGRLRTPDPALPPTARAAEPSADFFNQSVIAGRPAALQPEGGPTIDSLAYSKLGWGYWPLGGRDPVVDTWKWIETRCVGY